MFSGVRDGAGQLLSRAWLLDPVEAQVAATASGSTTEREREPWNGEWYVSFGQGPERAWTEAMRYGFICAGGGAWYSNTLNLLKSGERIWVKAPGYGFVGIGRVNAPPTVAAEFRLLDDENQPRPALEVLHDGHYHREFYDDVTRSEYFVSVEWAETVPLTKAINELGLFGTRTRFAPKTPKWRHTVERLKVIFPAYDRAA